MPESWTWSMVRPLLKQLRVLPCYSHEEVALGAGNEQVHRSGDLIG